MEIYVKYDANNVTLYQAFPPAIAAESVRLGHFGPSFSLKRMTWLKTSFLWMMWRSGWATKEGQERILAVQLPRTVFEQLLAQAVPSTFDPERYDHAVEWQHAMDASDILYQLDPDRDPNGNPLDRRTLHLGLRGEATRRYGHEWIVSLSDITNALPALRRRAESGEQFEQSYTPLPHSPLLKKDNKPFPPPPGSG
jgi:Domain of unknown function (DUF4291)